MYRATKSPAAKAGLFVAQGCFITRFWKGTTSAVPCYKAGLFPQPIYNVFDSSVNKTLSAPSFVRSLHKGWETADAHLDRKQKLENAPEQFSYWRSVRRGPGGPRNSRPGGRRYWFVRRSATSAKQECHSIPSGKMIYSLPASLTENERTRLARWIPSRSSCNVHGLLDSYRHRRELSPATVRGV
jgi:hypothetical protein